MSDKITKGTYKVRFKDPDSGEYIEMIKRLENNAKDNAKDNVKDENSVLQAVNNAASSASIALGTPHFINIYNKAVPNKQIRVSDGLRFWSNAAGLGADIIQITSDPDPTLLDKILNYGGAVLNTAGLVGNSNILRPYLPKVDLVLDILGALGTGTEAGQQIHKRFTE